MNRRDNQGEPIESDPVWDLLAQSPPPKARPSFVSDTLRAARLENATAKGWRGGLKHAWASIIARPLDSSGRLAALAAVVALAAITWSNVHQAPDSGQLTGNDLPASETTPTEPFAALQEIAEEELLLAAAENPSMFSDDEVLALLGF